MSRRLKLFLPMFLAAGMMAQSGKDDMKAAGGHYKDATKYAGVGIVKGTKKGLIATRDFFHEPKNEYHSKAKKSTPVTAHKSGGAASSHKSTTGAHRTTSTAAHHHTTSSTAKRTPTKKATSSN